VDTRWGGGDVCFFVEDAAEDFYDGVALEEAFACEHFVQHDAEGENIGAFVGGLAFGLLGGHVGGGAEDGTGYGSTHGERGGVFGVDVGGRLHRLREAEVEDFDDAFGGDLDVGGFEVAVDDVLLVGGFDAVDELLNEGQRVVEIERTLEVVAFDVLHH
jgi:hypothetical protein